jgi:large repetitive protein
LLKIKYVLSQDHLEGSATKAISLTVLKALSISTTSLPYGDPGVAYKTTTLKATGGTGKYSWIEANGTTLPDGLTLSSKGVIKGKPTNVNSGINTFSIQLSDGVVALTRNYTIKVYDPLALSVLPGGTIGATYNQYLADLTTGGSGGYKFTLKGALPPGLKFTASIGVISGTPTSTGNYPLTIKVTDNMKGTLTQFVTIIIN